MWGRVRKAAIPLGDRDTFERYGETVMGILLTGGLNQIAEELINIYGDKTKHPFVRDWLTERSDLREGRERRMEFVEWAIFIFVVLGVVVEGWQLLCNFGWLHFGCLHCP